ncbi:MAG: helix-turn-helix domain containing protein, partial [Methanobrevibacter sp.]|nr:helix-turn-helix domain containing protein [Candidatus Methanoflexus mossambicus]
MDSDVNYKVKRHVTPEVLNELICEGKTIAKNVNRLQFIQQMYKTNSVKKTCKILNIPERTGYNWVK